MKKTARILTVVFTVVSLFGSTLTAQAATVKSNKKAKYYKTASTKKKAGTFKKATKLTAKSMAKGFVKFKSGKKTLYIKVTDVKISGKFNAKVTKKTKAYNKKLKVTKTVLKKNKKLTISGMKVKKKVAYLKYAAGKFVKATDVKVTTFAYDKKEKVETPAPTVVPTVTPTATPAPTPRPTPTDDPNRVLNKDPDGTNIFKNYNFTEKRKTSIAGQETEYDYTVPIVHGDVEFTDQQLADIQAEFATSQTSPWNLAYGNDQGKLITISEQARRNGRYGLLFDVDYCGGHMKFLGLENNEDYVFDFWMNNKDHDGVFSVFAKRIGIDDKAGYTSNSQYPYYLSIQDTVENWTQYRLEFNTGDANLGEVLITWANQSLANVYVDDMRLYLKYEPITPVPTEPVPTETVVPTQEPVDDGMDLIEDYGVKMKKVVSATETKFSSNEMQNSSFDESRGAIVVNGKDYNHMNFKSPEYETLFTTGQTTTVRILAKGVAGKNFNFVVKLLDGAGGSTNSNIVSTSYNQAATGDWEVIELQIAVPENLADYTYNECIIQYQAGDWVTTEENYLIKAVCFD